VHEAGDTVAIADGRPLLPGLPAVGHTRLLLEAVTGRWRADGPAMLPALDGSFSLFLLDAGRGELTLVRDRFGSRPLFWARWAGGVFAASECKVLAALGIPLRLSAEVLDEVLVGRWVLGESHLLAPLQQVPVASWITLRPGEPTSPSRRYWRLPFEPENDAAGDLAHFSLRTRDTLCQSISNIAAGRNEIGVLLSGGVDSSVIAAATREVVGRCVGIVGRLPEGSNLELERALTVARHLGIECRVVDVVPPAFETEVRDLVRRVEEPPRHPNNLVLRQLLQHAASEVDLVLHGDGAEMLFGLADVKRVARFRRKRAVLSRIPARVRRAAADSLRRLDAVWAMRLARVLSWHTITYAAMLDAIGYAPSVQRHLWQYCKEYPPDFLPLEHFSAYGDFSSALQAYQAHTFLTPSLLRHDRLAQPLALSVESPFLRAPIVDFACRLPLRLRYTDGPKPVLRALCDHYLPPEVSRWPKLGFPVRWQDWLMRAGAGLPIARPPACDVLPAGFVAAAQEAGDFEALWTALTLQILAEEFGVEGAPAAATGVVRPTATVASTVQI
jgi:asparagine synthase (glutamine-hydrolysing)